MKIFKKKLKLILTVLVVLTISIGFFFYHNTPEVAEASWWDDTWSYRKTLTINSDQVTGDLTNFPVLVSLTDVSLSTHAQEDGDDFVFTLRDGTVLKHEIESYASTTGALVAWVKTPLLSSTQDTDIFMYYGNASVTDQSDAENVWDDNFIGVWHLPDNETSSTSDSTGNGYDGSTDGTDATTVSSAKIDGGMEFDGSGDYVDLGRDFDVPDLPLTFSAWVYIHDYDDWNTIIAKRDSWTNDDTRFLWQTNMTTGDVMFGSRDGVNTFSYNPPINQWAFLTIVANSVGTHLYANGQFQETSDPTVLDSDNLAMVYIGMSPDDQDNFDGVIDELRIMTASSSSTWIETSYNNQNDPSAFFAEGTEEVGPGPVGYWSFDEGYGTTAHDGSGQGNTGTVTGATWKDGGECISGKCLYFDGSGDYVSIADSDSLSITGDKITMSAWVKPTAAGESSDSRILSKNDGVTDSNYSLEFHSDLELGMRVNNAAPTEYNANRTSKLNEWVYVVGVYDGSNMIMYLNGVESGSVSKSGDIDDDNGSLTIGTHSTTPANRNFFGYIDEVKIYPYARSADQIRQDYNAGLAGASTKSGTAVSFGGNEIGQGTLNDGLIAYYKFDESITANGIYDSSGNGNSCTFSYNASTTSGKYGNALTLDGSLDEADCGAIPEWDVTNKSSASAWVKPTVLSDWQGVVNKGNDFYMGFYGDEACITYHAGGSWQNKCTSGMNYSTATWYHLVASIDNENDNIKMYVNNSLVIDEYDTDDVQDNNADVTIGAYSSQELQGLIDEVRLYDKILTAKEVTSLYEYGPPPVAHWKFDEMSGATAYDSVASSTTDGGNDGVISSASWAPTGKYGSALDFNGNGDYAYVNPNTKQEFGTGSFTTSFWIKADSYPVGQDNSEAGIVGKLDVSYWSGWMVLMEDSGYIRFYTDDGSSEGTNWSDNSLALDTWYYVTAVIDRENNEQKIYINGVENSDINDISGYGSFDSQTSNEILIGARRGDVSYFDGKIDDVRIYNYALTSKQINKAMNNDRQTGSPLLHLTFDEGRGATAHDSSGLGNDGSLQPGIGGSNTSSSSMWTKDGLLGGAMEFDGTDDHVAIAGGAGSVWDIPGSEVTVSAWVTTGSSAGGSGDRIVAKSSTDASDDYGIQATGNGRYRFRIRTGGGLTEINSPDAKYPYDGTWHHILGVYDGAYMKLYIDGNLEASSAKTGTLVNGGSTVLYVGQTKNLEGTRWYHGKIDEVKIWNYAFTEDEINIDYNLGKASVMGEDSGRNSNGTTVTGDNRDYCIPGDTAQCDAPILELKFDEMSGSTAYDTSGNGFDGSISNATWKPNGKKGSALEFDGSSDQVIVPYSSTLTPANITFTAWYYPRTTDRVLFKSAGGPGYGGAWRFNYWSESLSLQMNFGGPNPVSLYDVKDVPLNRWVHAAFSYDGSTVKVYQDGALINSFATTSPINYTDSSSFLISQSDFDGIVDEVRMYDYARTPAQIAWDYNRGKPIAHWKFDECSGSTIHDYAGTNHGQLYLGTGGVTATGTCASSSDSFWYNGRSGKENGSGSFDGNDDYVSIGTDNIPDTDDEKTFATWVKASSIGSNITFYSDNVVQARVNGSGNLETSARGASLEDTGKSIVAGQWHHIVISLGNTNQRKVYLNGQLIFTAIESSGGSVTTPKIGSNFVGGQSWNGQIDEVKIWNYALTAEQVKQDYNGGAVRFGN